MSDNIEVVEYAPNLKQDWDSHVQRSKNSHFFFYRDYLDYHKHRFTDKSLLVRIRGNTEAVLPGHIDGDTYYTHQGLTFGGLVGSRKIRAVETGQIVAAILDHLRNSGIATLIYKKLPFIYNDEPFDDDIYHLIQQGASPTICELNQVIDYRQYSISTNRVQGYKKAKSRGVSIREQQNYVQFWSILTNNLLKHDATPTHSLEEINLLASSFPDNIKLYCAEHGGRTLSGAVLFVNNHTVHTQYIAAEPEAHEVHALEFLLHEIVQMFADKRYFSFGISNEQKGKVLNEGLARFKESFGARGVAHITFAISL